jgi:hypothetical protein
MAENHWQDGLSFVPLVRHAGQQQFSASHP